jgi:hypothetical protein
LRFQLLANVLVNPERPVAPGLLAQVVKSALSYSKDIRSRLRKAQDAYPKLLIVISTKLSRRLRKIEIGRPAD